MKYSIFLLLVSFYCVQTSFASLALTTQPGDISKKKCKEYSQKVQKCDHTVQEITQGVKIAEENEFPHMGLIGYNNKGENSENEIHWACEGSIISVQYVITAAQCLSSEAQNYVKIGVNNLTDNSNAQEFEIIEQILHPNATLMSYYNDIALVKLDKKIQFTEDAYPACLDSNTHLNVQKAILSGFEYNVPTNLVKRDKLKKAVVKITSEEKCSSTYKILERKLRNGIDHKTQFCGEVLSREEETYNPVSGDPLQIYHNEEDGVKCMYDIIGFVTFGKSFNNHFPEGIYKNFVLHRLD